MTRPLVSIVIPCYNGQRTVAEAIRSALRQTYANREVIVVDDGSTDASLSVILSFGDAIRYATGPNQGASASRNRGVDLAQGELVQFLDADDLLHEEKLARQVPAILSGKADIVYCDWLRLEAGQSAPVRCSCQPDEHDPLLMLLCRNFQTSAPIHWKHRLQAVGGFRSGVEPADDRDLHLRLAAAGASFYRLAEPLFTFRQTPGSLSSNYVDALDQHSAILWPILEDLRSRGELTDTRARAFAAFMARDARHYLQYACNEKAVEYFRQARRMHPRGGLDEVYTAPTRTMHRFFGPVLTHVLVSWKRRVCRP